MFAEQGCTDFLDFKWHWENRLGKVNKIEATKAKFIFKSTANKTIKITKINLKTKSKDTVKERKMKSFYLPAYGKDYTFLYDLDKINLDVVGFGGFGCRFEEKPKAKIKTYKPKQKSGAQRLLDKIRGN